MEKRKDNTISVDNVIVAYEYPNPVLDAHIYTVMDMHNHEILTRLETILDESPIVNAVKIDERVPPRRKYNRFRGILVELVKNSKDDHVLIQSTSGGKLPFDIMMTLKHKGRIGLIGKRDAGYSWITVTLQKKELETNDFLETKKLFIEICKCIKAFFGYVSEHSLIKQRNIYMALAVDNVFDRKKQPDFDIELPDVFWLNYFGPGYVDHWGEDKIKALERAYHTIRDKNNGIFVQTTEEPLFEDENVKKVSDYMFKEAMYDILGSDIFIHEDQQEGERGELVPTLEEQRKYV